MPDASTFDMKQNFPIASVADLYANRSYKEAQMRAQQQEQLVQGLQQFGQGVDSLVQRRMQMAQALAAAHIYAGTLSGQQALGTNQVTTDPTGQPVQHNQTAAFDPSTGIVTPNQPQATMGDISTAMFGAEPKDVFANITAQKQLSYEPQKIAIEAQKAKAEADNNAILRTIQLQLAGNTVTHTKSEDINTLLTRRAEAEKDLPTGFFSSLNNPKAKAAQQSIDEINSQLASKGYSTGSDILPEIGKTITHSSGVKIKRIK